jgi:hypothetical protein
MLLTARCINDGRCSLIHCGNCERTFDLDCHFVLIVERAIACSLADSHRKGFVRFQLVSSSPFYNLSLFMVAPFTASLYSRLQLVEHENRLQNQAISNLQCQNERLSLAIARVHIADTFSTDTTRTARRDNRSQVHSASNHQGSQAYDIYRHYVAPSVPSQQLQVQSALQHSSHSQKQRLKIKLPSSQTISADLNSALKLAASFDPVIASCSHGCACRKEFCDLAHSAFFCFAHGVHCLHPAAGGIMSLSKARLLHDAHFSIPQAASSAATPVDDRFCVWIHGHCGKFQPRSNHLCRSGFREVRVLCDARQPKRCRSWALLRSVSCFSSRDNRGNCFSARSLRQAVERQLPSLLLEVAADSFMFNSAATAMEALQLMLSDAEQPVSMVHVM